MQGRLSDTNANLVTRSLVVASELAAAMGPAWDKTAREFCKSALDCLGDKKKPVGAICSGIWSHKDDHILTRKGRPLSCTEEPAVNQQLCVQVRDGVVTLLEAWARVSGPDRVLPALAEYLASPKAAMAEGKVRPPPSTFQTAHRAHDALAELQSMIGSASLTRSAMYVQAAAIQWAKTAVHGGSAVSCLESAVRVASLGVLDKGAETREAGTALMLALAQVSLLLPLLSGLAWQLI